MSTRFHLSVSVNQGYKEVRWVKDFVWPQGLIVSLNLLQAVKNRDFFFSILYFTSIHNVHLEIYTLITTDKYKCRVSLNFFKKL